MRLRLITPPTLGTNLVSYIVYPQSLSPRTLVTQFSGCLSLPIIQPRRSSVLKDGDIMKVDFGIHVKGRIVDSAFTMSWNPAYENLLKAVQDATNTGVRVGISIHFNGYSNTNGPANRKRGSMFASASLVDIYKKLWNPMKS